MAPQVLPKLTNVSKYKCKLHDESSLPTNNYQYTKTKLPYSLFPSNHFCHFFVKSKPHHCSNIFLIFTQLSIYFIRLVVSANKSFSTDTSSIIILMISITVFFFPSLPKNVRTLKLWPFTLDRVQIGKWK